MYPIHPATTNAARPALLVTMTRMRRRRRRGRVIAPACDPITISIVALEAELAGSRDLEVVDEHDRVRVVRLERRDRLRTDLDVRGSRRALPIAQRLRELVEQNIRLLERALEAGVAQRGAEVVAAQRVEGLLVQHGVGAEADDVL